MCTTKTFTSTFPPFLCATSLHTGHSYFHITYEIDHSLKALLTRPRFDLRFGQFDHNFTIHSSLMKKVIKNINVFRSFVKLRILCQFDRNFIIYVQDNFLMTLILKINQQLPQTDCLFSCSGCYHIHRFRCTLQRIVDYTPRQYKSRPYTPERDLLRERSEDSNSRAFIALITLKGNILIFRMPGRKLFVLNPGFQGRKRHITSFLETATLMLVCLLFPDQCRLQ